MYQGGADIVYHAAGGSGGGVFTAAKAAGKLAIGVDSDQAKTAAADVRDVIMTSMIKKVDVGVYDFIKSVTRTTPSRPATRSSTSRPAASTTPRPAAKIDDIKSKLDDVQAEDHLRRDHGPEVLIILIQEGTAWTPPPDGPVARAAPPGPSVCHPLGTARLPVASARRRPRRGGPARGGVSSSTRSRPAAGRRRQPPAPAVELDGITKRFPGVVANKDIEITVGAGTVHAIVGENGAGKSTLMKILYGVQQPDEGTIEVDGTDADPALARPTPSTPASAWSSSTSCWPTTSPSSRTSSSARRSCTASATRPRKIREISDAYGLEVDPDALVAELGVGERQRIEILKVLYRGARIIILDEPTAVLVPQEVAELFDNLRELKSEGLTVIFISHKLDEVL